MNNFLHQTEIAFQHHASQLPGKMTDWLPLLRERAFAKWQDAGLPTSHQEDWKYTRLNALNKQDFQFNAPSAQTLSVWPFPEDHYIHRLVWIDGQFSVAFSRLDALPAAVIASDLVQVLQENPAWLQAYFMDPLRLAQPEFSALNLACLSQGAYLEIPAHTMVEGAIALFFISTTASEGHATHLRNRIILGENSQATVVEHYCHLEKPLYFNNVVTDITLGVSAQLQYYTLQQESRSAFHISRCTVQQQRNSALHACAIAEGAGLSHSELLVQLQGEGAACALSGLYLAAEHQHLAQHPRIEHNALHTSSHVLYKGLICDQAHAVFDGKVTVFKDAQKTAAQLHNQNLLLSAEAAVDTKPQLEIDANDVQCSHGATVGQLNEAALFYLRARGIEESAARRLLMYAFADEVLAHIRCETIRQQLSQSFSARFQIQDDGWI